MPNHILQVDQLLRETLPRFIARIERDKWQGKERDCVNRFAMGYLIPACGKHPFLEHATQIGIEMSVRQPSRVGARPTAPKDLVIWRERWPRLWDDKEKAVLAPLAVLEWKVLRGAKGGRDTTHDTKWLRGFAKSNPKSVGYSIAVRFGEDGRHCCLSVCRFVRDKQATDWFEA